MADSATNEPIGILAAGGRLPIEIASALQESGREPFIVGLETIAAREIEQFPHEWVASGKVGRILGAFRAAGCSQILIIGRFDRPELSSIRLDATALANLPRFTKLLKGGDDAVLTGVIGFIEEKGFQVVGIGDVLPGLLTHASLNHAETLSKSDLSDIDHGFRALDALSEFDVGQSAIVLSGRVIALEAAEGTDAMIARITDLRKIGRVHKSTPSGVLVKAAKQGQDMRVDIPVIGPTTIEQMKLAGLRGVAVRVGQVLLADRETTMMELSRNRMFFHVWHPQ